jgi:hypothetical protein
MALSRPDDERRAAPGLRAVFLRPRRAAAISVDISLCFVLQGAGKRAGILGDSSFRHGSNVGISREWILFESIISLLFQIQLVETL